LVDVTPYFDQRKFETYKENIPSRFFSYIQNKNLKYSEKNLLAIIFVFLFDHPGFVRLNLTMFKSEAHQYITDSEIFITRNFF